MSCLLCLPIMESEIWQVGETPVGRFFLTLFPSKFCICFYHVVLLPGLFGFAVFLLNYPLLSWLLGLSAPPTSLAVVIGTHHLPDSPTACLSYHGPNQS